MAWRKYGFAHTDAWLVTEFPNLIRKDKEANVYFVGGLVIDDRST